LLSKLATQETVLVANPGVFAASFVHEKLGVPLTNLILQPWMIPSSIAPPIMPNFTFLSHAPRPVWKVFWRGLDVVVDILIGRELNGLRAALGLKPMPRILQNWLSRRLVIGMFPDWYGLPQADWPAQMRLVGFPLFDGGQRETLAPEVLEFCRAGTPPVAFTFGTGMAHSAGLFRAALEACEILGARYFLTNYRDQLPDPCRRPCCTACLLHFKNSSALRRRDASAASALWRSNGRRHPAVDSSALLRSNRQWHARQETWRRRLPASHALQRKTNRDSFGGIDDG
jgi:hypothetical protein